MTHEEILLRGSLVIQQQKKLIAQQAAQIALLTARLRVADAKFARLTQYELGEDVPMLLRKQAGL